MALLRFPTVRDVCEAFPSAENEIGEPSTDENSIVFLRSLVERQACKPAVAFCTYLLPRREAVWWGCQTLRQLQPQLTLAEDAALHAAESWVREPEENLRRAALSVGLQCDAAMPATWMALAAGWSGGSITPVELNAVRAPADQTARAVRSAILIAMSRIPDGDISPLLTQCLENAISLAEGKYSWQ